MPHWYAIVTAATPEQLKGLKTRNEWRNAIEKAFRDAGGHVDHIWWRTDATPVGQDVGDGLSREAMVIASGEMSPEKVNEVLASLGVDKVRRLFDTGEIEDQAL
jgi:hypothetical protein